MSGAAVAGAAGVSRAIEAGELKALVRQLVKAAGWVEACGIELCVSPQRVSQWQSVEHPDQMSMLNISRLEAVVGRPIVTGVAARAAEGSAVDEAMLSSAVEAMSSAAALVSLVHAMEADGTRTEAEKRAAREATQDLLRQAQEAADTAARL
jgi:hypothetical protein